jgi:hypothetical protein
MRPGKNTYFSVELPDAEAAVKLAKQIAERTVGPVIVADDDGNLIGSFSRTRPRLQS